MSSSQDTSQPVIDDAVRAHIQAAFLNSRKKYLRDAARAEEGGEEAAVPEASQQALDKLSQEWQDEVAAIRERKKQRVSVNYFGEESRQSLQRVLRGEAASASSGPAAADPSALSTPEQRAVEEIEQHAEVAKKPAKVDKALRAAAPNPVPSRRAVFDAIKVGSLLRKSELVTVKASLNVRHVLDEMTKHDVSAVPVVHGGKVVGLLDVADVVRGLVDDLRNDETTHDVEHFMDTATAGDLAKTDRVRFHWHALDEHDSLAHALSMFAQGVHRCVVLDAHHAALGIISQSTIAHLFATHVELLGDLANKKVSEVSGLMRAREEIVTVQPGTPAWIALHHMTEHNVTGVGLVHPDGHELAGEVSVRTLRGLRYSRMHLLARPLNQLLTVGPYNMRLAVVAADAPVSAAVDELVETKRQRVWVVQPGTQRHLVGLVTVTDLARVLVAL